MVGGRNVHPVILLKRRELAAQLLFIVYPVFIEYFFFEGKLVEQVIIDFVIAAKSLHKLSCRSKARKVMASPW